ncbi:hypothetical protein THMIRHAS_06070 [Thiosulfatimonas sediminis]|uniref:ACB domain-containing protein n=1 Tax=Thiosulfatimonas sediminis TaxID=2675054 RepID=A0A6F8PT79_9GAMM|nr:acyl-CoA-binding protein [Thiosulfatimonas sediminis]BBP45234.1 hypothetical protein THMIRHAS_06070 [Thiosulfatimonas sediminis]
MNTHSSPSLPDALAIYNELYSVIKQTQGAVELPYADECLLGGLYRQALFGDCIRTGPSRNDLHDYHKHEIWCCLKGISREEATTLFIQELNRVKTTIQQSIEQLEMKTIHPIFYPTPVFQAKSF